MALDPDAAGVDRDTEAFPAPVRGMSRVVSAVRADCRSPTWGCVAQLYAQVAEQIANRPHGPRYAGLRGAGAFAIARALALMLSTASLASRSRFAKAPAHM